VIATAIDHLSHSQIQSFAMCPRKWHYEKVEHAPRERIPASFAFGIAVHDTLAAVNEAALHGETVNAAGLFVALWQQSIAGELPVHYGRDDADDLQAKGRALVSAYQPPPGVIGVEQPFTVELDPELPPVEGFIDLIRRNEHGDLVLSDLKTSSSRMLTETDAVEAQLGLYDIAYPAVRHEAIVLGKLKVPTVTIQPITPWPQAQVRRHYAEVYHAMQAGVRFANRGWACESCPFANRCRQEN
jgi:CRISPR/Cas system-associated exonuclease Cas4 (RecB family)